MKLAHQNKELQLQLQWSVQVIEYGRGPQLRILRSHSTPGNPLRPAALD